MLAYRGVDVLAFILVSIGILATLPVAAAEAGPLTGTVKTNTGQPAPGAEVTIVELRRSSQTDSEGTFTFGDVPPGRYILEATSPRYGSALVQVVVQSGSPTAIEIRLELSVHHEDVVVSAGAYARSSAETAQPVDVIDGTELQSVVQPTLGETLSKQPGITSTSYSPGTSRPVVRGIGGDRIRILQDGVGVGDASNVSEDHAVTTNPLSAERIEIVRGAATLLYGSNAVGGVVNVLDNRIPDHVPDHPVEGSVEVRYGSAADDRAGAVSLDGGHGHFTWHLDGFDQGTGDVSTPVGDLANSDSDSSAGSAGVSWVSNQAFLGVSYSRFDTTYGIPTDEMISIDMGQNRYDLAGEYRPTSGFLQAIRYRIGSTDYQHAEIESDGAIGTQFFNDSWEGRVEFPHRQAGPFKGAFGVQLSSRDFEAVGEEGFVPPTTTDNRAAFVFEEIGSGKVTFEAGARYESQDNTASSTELFPDPGPDRSFGGLSGSGAFVWKPKESAWVSLTLSRTTRMPTAEELYANGPHAATFQFQVGDPTLGEEKSLGLDLSLRKRGGVVSGELNLFANRYDGFIFLGPTGAFVDVDGELFPEFRFAQVDSEFRGGEIHVDVELLHRDPHHLQLELGADSVRAEVTNTNDPLPRIPPRRESAGIRYQGPHFWGLLEVRRTERQDRNADFETPTDGYTWFNAILGYRIVAGRTVHDIVLRGNNLSDELARNHVSPLKDFVPLPGRDVNASYRLTF
jgi:iron complex outermembrane receptor protein